MSDHHDEFYKKSSKKFKAYKFQVQGKLVSGVKPDFFSYLKKFSNTDSRVMDLGCGSGEMTLKLSPLFQEIIGVDPYKDYIQTANGLKQETETSNVSFLVADGKSLPFENEYFDIVLSSRGPLSADFEFMKEGFRVLKYGGLMIEDTIGEQDKMELKKIFGRGQGYPVRGTKLESIQELLALVGMQLVDSTSYLFYQVYPSIDQVIEILERAPIIPDFDNVRDRKYLDEINEKLNQGGITLSSHRLCWVARK